MPPSASVSPLHFLIAESETPEERAERRRSAGKSSGETYQSTLQQLRPGCDITIMRPAEADAPRPSEQSFDQYDAVVLTGSPLHVYDDTPEVRRQLDFMRAVFTAGIPSFGSCAGLQVAVTAAGGRCRKMERRMEAGVARAIVRTNEGRDHPLLNGRPAVWDAPAIHGDEVDELPAGAVLLASNAAVRVQAVEIRHRRGVFWGVQYHPELAIGEIGAALRRQAADLVSAGLARDEADVVGRADLLDALHDSPGDPALRWLAGIDGEFADEASRRRELNNFISALPELDGRARLADHP